MDCGCAREEWSRVSREFISHRRRMDAGLGVSAMRAGVWAIGLAALEAGGCRAYVEAWDDWEFDANVEPPPQGLGDALDELGRHPVQLQLLGEMRCEGGGACQPKTSTDPTPAYACELGEGPWRPQARDALFECIEACRARGCGPCFETDCPAEAAERAGLSADAEVAATCETRWGACDLGTVSCAVFAVVEGDALERLEGCLEEDCDSVHACVNAAFYGDPDVDMEADAGV